MSQAPKQLNESELKALGEIHIEINWKGLWKAWRTVFEQAPLSAYQKITRGVEGFSRKIMTGHGAVIGMPAGIILRNTARSMHNSSEGRYLHGAEFIGVLAGVGAFGAAVWFGGPIAITWLGAQAATLLGATAAHWSIAALTWGAGYLGAIMAGSLAAVPAYTAGTLICSTAIGAAVAVFSTCISAPANFGKGWNRTVAAWKGIKMSEAELEAIQTEFDKDSPSVRHEREQMHTARNAFGRLSDENQKKLFADIKAEFDAVAAKEAEKAAESVPAAAPAPAPKA